jgi:2-keto-3-deoxy-galactonokinase
VGSVGLVLIREVSWDESQAIFACNQRLSNTTVATAAEFKVRSTTVTGKYASLTIVHRLAGFVVGICHYASFKACSMTLENWSVFTSLPLIDLT